MTDDPRRSVPLDEDAGPASPLMPEEAQRQVDAALAKEREARSGGASGEDGAGRAALARLGRGVLARSAADGFVTTDPPSLAFCKLCHRQRAFGHTADCPMRLVFDARVAIGVALLRRTDTDGFVPTDVVDFCPLCHRPRADGHAEGCAVPGALAARSSGPAVDALGRPLGRIDRIELDAFEGSEGSLDELVAHGFCHVERMDERWYYVGVADEQFAIRWDEEAGVMRFEPYEYERLVDAMGAGEEGAGEEG